jgi:glycosyltransferase involved in cell wall biosynthesis
VSARVALCTRELHPFVGGGIAPIMRALADQLAESCEVTLFTTAAHRPLHEQLRPQFAPGVRLVFVEEPPEGPGGFYTWLQAWSHRLYEAIKAAYPDGGPDLVEFGDYLGEGFVTLQAARTADPFLAATTVAVRLHTTAEMVAVLNGHCGTDVETQVIFDMERYCLANADTLLWPGGDVLATYERFYGTEQLAPARRRIPDAFLVEGKPAAAPTAGEGPLRLLYLGRMERRKGVQDLVRALAATGADGWRLTLLGGDTPTGPLGTSMRTCLELMTEHDPRVTFADPVPRAAGGRVVAEHDAVVVPSRWECWPNVAREALYHGRPVIATPVGGLVEFVRPGQTGWLASGTGADALAKVLEPLVSDPASVRAYAGRPELRRVLGELSDPAMIRARYAELPRRRPVPVRRGRRPLVSVVVPYFRLDAHVRETLASVRAQTHPRIETIVVNDGSLREQDAFLFDLPVRVVTQRNRGLGAARNLGVAAARGRYVLPLDADDVLAPTFVERCLAALEAVDDLAYVGAWSRYVDEQGEPMPGADPGYAPLGNWARLCERTNAAGSATALIRRHLFDLGFAYDPDLVSYEDWSFYLRLRRAGHFGAIVPEALLSYRVRPASMLRSEGADHRERLAGEVAARVTEGAVRWTSQSA